MGDLVDEVEDLDEEDGGWVEDGERGLCEVWFF